MQHENPGVRGPIGPLDWRKIIPLKADAASDLLGWVSLEAARYRAAPASELSVSPLTHHTLVLINRPPEELDLGYEGVKRHVPPPAGSISLVPAGSPTLWRWRGPKDSLHVYLEPGLIERVAAEAFDLDPARLTVPPLDALDLPQLRAAMGAVDAELTSGGAGGPLAAESLANVLAVQLIRHVSAPRRPARGRDGALPRRRHLPRPSKKSSASIDSYYERTAAAKRTAAMTDWPQIIREHGPMVWSTVYRLLTHDADAADCFQRTFLSALELSRTETVRSWPGLLRRLATARALEALRERYRQAARREPLVADSAVSLATSQPPEAAQANELAQHLRDALAGLDDRLAQVFCLACLEGYRYVEIAELLGITVNHVGVLLNRARAFLQERLRSHAPAAAHQQREARA